MTDCDEAIRERCQAWLNNLAGSHETIHDHAAADLLYLLDRVAALESALAEAQQKAEEAERDMNRCCPCEVCNKSCKYDKTNAYDECADFEWRGPEGERAPSKEDKP